MIQMISTLVLRQESQQTIHHQDTGFMLFIQTSAPRNIAQSLYQIGQTWQSTKRGQPHGPEVPDETTDSSGTPGPPTATACPGQDGGKSGAQGDRGGPDGAPLACPRAGPLAAEYQSPVLSMFLEVGLRTEAAQTTWRNLHLLARSAAWASGITIVMPMP